MSLDVPGMHGDRPGNRYVPEVAPPRTVDGFGESGDIPEVTIGVAHNLGLYERDAAVTADEGSDDGDLEDGLPNDHDHVDQLTGRDVPRESAEPGTARPEVIEVALPIVRARERGAEGRSAIGAEGEAGEVRNDLPRWGQDLPATTGVDGAWERFFGKAAQTLMWATVEQLANQFVPGAGVIVRIAYFVARYRAVLAGLNDGRGADLQVGLGGGAPLGLAFTIRLGAADDGPFPRVRLLFELNFMDHLDQGEPDAEGPGAVAAILTPPARPDPSFWDLYGIEAVRDHATILELAASLTPGEFARLRDVLRRKWVRCFFAFDHAAGTATITVADGYRDERVTVPLP
jgi:hypothetical protein